jgi:hypothetical protein
MQVMQWLQTQQLSPSNVLVVAVVIDVAVVFLLIVCGFVFKSSAATGGTFTSPNFPGLYPRNTECHYLFHGIEGEVVYITFKYFDVEGIPPA